MTLAAAIVLVMLVGTYAAGWLRGHAVGFEEGAAAGRREGERGDNE